jgi:hypothetical protein
MSNTSAVLAAIKALEERGLKPCGAILRPDTWEAVSMGEARIFGLRVEWAHQSEPEAVWAYAREPRRLEVVGRVYEPLPPPPSAAQTATGAESVTPAFEVIRPDGHAYRVWEDGRIEGFDGNPIVINRIPAIANRRLDEQRLAAR